MDRTPLTRTGFQWTNRRRWVWVTSVFNMAVIGYVLWTDSDSRLAETALAAAFSLLAWVGAAYLGVAGWEHGRLAAAELRDRQEHG